MITFPRYYRPSAIVTIGPPGVLTVTDINAPPPAPRGPRITFRIKRSLMSTPDECDCSIFNLDPIREKALVSAFQEVGRAPCSVAAGYGVITPIVFRGDLRTMDGHRRDGPDYALVFSADDGGDWMSELTTSISTVQWTVQNMVDYVVAAVTAGDPSRRIAPYPLALHPSVGIAIAASPFSGTQVSGVHIGKVKELIDEAARLCNARWWIADNLLYFATRKIPVDGLSIVLRRPQWMQEPSDDGKGVVRHVVMFDPNIQPGRQVTLVDDLFRRSSSPEPFRCEVAEHVGDTRGGPWTTSMVLRRITGGFVG